MITVIFLMLLIGAVVLSWVLAIGAVVMTLLGWGEFESHDLLMCFIHGVLTHIVCFFLGGLAAMFLDLL